LKPPRTSYKPKRMSKGRSSSKKQQQQNFSSSMSDLGQSDESILRRSGWKNPKYRVPNNKTSNESASTATVTTGSLSHTSLSYTSRSPSRRVSFSSYDNEGGGVNQVDDDGPPRVVLSASLQNIQIPEEECSYVVKPSVPPQLMGSINSSKTVSSNSTASPSTSTTQIFDLPWLDKASNGKLHGLYSGPVSSLLAPHGEGTLILEGNCFLKFYGHWIDGELISPLMNEDEKREQDRTRSLLAGDDEKSSKEFKTKSSKEYKKKSSKDRKKKKKDKRRGSSSSARDISPAHSGGSDKSKNKPRHLRETKYGLGEVARTPRDMVIRRSNEKAIHSASLLKKYDQAFVKRSNGLWTCSVQADRALQPTTASSARWYTKSEIDETMSLEEAMLFVINEDGATKIIKKRHWGKFIRCLYHHVDGDK